MTGPLATRPDSRPARLSCDEVQKFLNTYLDGELDATDAGAFDAHLLQCTVCSRLADFERRFKARLQAAAPAQPKAPPGLRARLRALPVEGGERLPALPALLGGLRPRPVPALVSVAMLAALIVWNAHPGFQPLVDDSVARHTAGILPDVNSAEPEKIRRFLTQKLDFNVRLPPKLPKNYNLQGAGLSSVRNTQAAYVLFDRQGRRVSLLAFPGRLDPDVFVAARLIKRQPVFFTTARGYNVALWQNRQVAYALVADAPEAEMAEIVEGTIERE